MHQIEGHPYLEQWPLLKFCKEHEIAVTAYSPLGSPGRYSYTCNGSAVIDHSNRDVKASGEPHLLSEPSVIRCNFDSCPSGLKVFFLLPLNAVQDRRKPQLHSSTGEITSAFLMVH